MDDDVRGAATDHIRTQVRRGHGTFLHIVADTVEYLDGYGEPAELRALAWSIAGEEFAAALAAQATWPERTDNDRLAEVFRTLDSAGIVARQDFACCQNCGVTEIRAEVPDPAAARGYVFYHQQDAERAVHGGGVDLAFGVFDADPTVEIGTEVAAALRALDLPVTWDNSAGQRIHVGVDWALRRHGRFAAFASAPEPAPDVEVEIVDGAQYFRVKGPQSAEVLAQLELPWLPADVRLRITPLASDGAGSPADGHRGRGDRAPIVVRREFDRLVTDDGRVAGRFDGLRLLRGEVTGEPAEEAGLLEVRYDARPYHHDRPMLLAEAVDVVRVMPTSGTWFGAQGRDRTVVQMVWPDGKLWVETPNEAEEASTGANVSTADAERMLAILATEHRSAVAELPGARVEPW